MNIYFKQQKYTKAENMLKEIGKLVKKNSLFLMKGL